MTQRGHQRSQHIQPGQVVGGISQLEEEVCEVEHIEGVVPVVERVLAVVASNGQHEVLHNLRSLGAIMGKKSKEQAKHTGGRKSIQE